ncbi:MAG TPA: patatin-like phospholipase family protein [Alphaproteobacteria bacterium]|nr:patatin-like phospholipase family protein [Alphaproteobacteria bacterium]
MPVTSSNPTLQPSGQTVPQILPPIHTVGPAIVLSGGGAKGDFEVGAVRCLYNKGIRPKILCGTSVGSVNALKLAEGEDTPVQGTPPAGHVRGLAGLEKIWLDLNTDPDMWSLEPGVSAIFTALENLPAEANVLEKEASQVSSASIFGIVLSIFGVPGFVSFAPQLGDLGNLSNSASQILESLAGTLTDAENILGMANYDPLEALMRKPSSFFLPFQQQSGIVLRLAMVALEDGALRYVNENNVMIERDGTTTKVPPPLTAAQLAQLKGQLAEANAKAATLAPSQPGDPGPFQKPRPGLAAAKQQAAQLQAQLDWQELPKDLIRAAIASSSLPVICRPTEMQDLRTYVDGGIRTLAPIQAAIDAGASQVYVVAAGSTKFDASTLAQIGSSTPLPLLGIALRVGEQILPDEVGRRDLFPDNPYPVPVMVIQPDPSLDDIHDGLTIEPGLIRIRMAYGFMRAYDTFVAFQKFNSSAYQSAAEQNSIAGKTEEIIQLRKQIWDLEFPANGKAFELPTSALPPAPYTVKNIGAPDANAHAQVKTLKAKLKTLLDARIAHYTDAANNINGTESLPADFATWPTQWEKHSWAPVVPL